MKGWESPYRTFELRTGWKNESLWSLLLNTFVECLSTNFTNRDIIPSTAALEQLSTGAVSLIFPVKRKGDLSGDLQRRLGHH